MATKIMCATDGTKNSEHAVAFAADLAKRLAANLTFLMVNPVLLERGSRAFLLTEEQVKKGLDAAAKLAASAGVADARCVATKARDVGGAIVLYAEENGVDHIVVGSGSKGAASRLLIGSVSNDVVNKAHCPVTVVH